MLTRFLRKFLIVEVHGLNRVSADVRSKTILRLKSAAKSETTEIPNGK